MDFERLCRACMTETSTDYKTIFSVNSDNNVKLSDMLSTCTSLQVVEEDGLPSKICVLCEQQLTTAYIFRRQCIVSEGVFRTQLGVVDSEIKEEPVLGAESPLIPVKQEEVDDNEDASHIKVPPVGEEPAPVPVKRGPGRPRKLPGRLPGRPKSQIMHTCEVCKKEFTKESKLIRHMSVHDSTRKPFECEICKKRFLRIDLLTRHMVIHTAKLNFTNNMKYDHSRDDTKSESSDIFPALLEPDCHINDDVFSDDKNNSDYESKDIELLPSFSYKEEDKDDKDDKDDEKKDINHLKCEKCPQTFKKEEKLAVHIMKAHNSKRKYGNKEDKDYSCKICQKSFNRSSHLRRHEKIHMEVKEHKCTICPKTFSRGEFLINHLNKHSGIKPCVCHICNKSFAKQGVLNKHLITHSGEKSFLCNICGKSFNASSTLRQHVFRHSGQKPFQCQVCQARFTEKGTLKKHMITHTGERAHVCEECGNRFTTGFSLIKHKRIHTGEKPYSCDYCPKRFISLFILQNHVRTHTGEKPFQCSYCERAFAQKSDMIKHTRTHTGESPYVCTICGQAFKQPSALKTHGKTHERTLQQQQQNQLLQQDVE